MTSPTSSAFASHRKSASCHQLELERVAFICQQNPMGRQKLDPRRSLSPPWHAPLTQVGEGNKRVLSGESWMGIPQCQYMECVRGLRSDVAASTFYTKPLPSAQVTHLFGHLLAKLQVGWLIFFTELPPHAFKGFSLHHNTHLGNHQKYKQAKTACRSMLTTQS